MWDFGHGVRAGRGKKPPVERPRWLSFAPRPNGTGAVAELKTNTITTNLLSGHRLPTALQFARRPPWEWIAPNRSSPGTAWTTSPRCHPHVSFIPRARPFAHPAASFPSQTARTASATASSRSQSVLLLGRAQNCRSNKRGLTSVAARTSLRMRRDEHTKTGASVASRPGAGRRPWLPRTIDASRPMTSI